MLFNHSVHWQCLILSGSNLPLGDKAGAAFFQSYFLLKQMLFLIQYLFPRCLAFSPTAPFDDAMENMNGILCMNREALGTINI